MLTFYHIFINLANFFPKLVISLGKVQYKLIKVIWYKLFQVGIEMENSNLYQDIAKRTDGDIYVGVVGPVRTGKSTFIKNFMDLLVIPNIYNE